MSTAKVLLAREDGKFMIKVKGRATFESSPPLRSFVNNLASENLKEICIDLAECTGMDSTFMGMLAMIGMKSKGFGISVTILNADENSMKLMSGLGIHKLFAYSKSSPDAVQKHDWSAPEAPAATKIENAKTVLDAHETLIQVDNENLRRFKNVVEFVKKDIQKEEGGGVQENTPK